MPGLRQTLKPILIGISLFLLAHIVSSCTEHTTPLATYDGGIVNQDNFINHYEKYLQVTGLSDNLPDRIKILRSVLHEALILKDWNKNALDDDPAVTDMLRRQEEQALLDALWAEKIETSAEPSPQVLATMLVNERTRYHLLQAQYADLVSTQIMAQNWLNDASSLIYEDMGFILLEDLHPRLVNIVTDLSNGEISAPIRMGKGYTLIKLVDKQIPYFIRPRDFAAAQGRLRQEWQVIRADSAANAYTQSVLGGLKLEFDDQGCLVLLDILSKSSKPSLESYIAESKLSGTRICKADGREWTLAMLIPHLIDSQPGHLNAPIDVADMRNLISGIFVRRTLIEKARKSDLDSNVETRVAIQKRQDLWRLKTWQKRFSDTVTIPENYLTSLTEISRDSEILRREVEYYVFPDTLSATLAVEQLNHLQFSSPETRDQISTPNLPALIPMGWITTEEVGSAASLIFKQKLNTWTQPWNYNNEIYIFRSSAEKNEPLDLAQLRNEIERQVRAQGAPVQLEQALLVMERKNHAIIFEERIKNIPYIQLSGPVDEG
ncbi:MAG: peptidylprolyl isomerase [Candidatus Marinimicrobia bacterium]|nr:peptidylprolyl isomerase [Candidatus Neomarinimicrobiota bacterium]